MSVLQRLPSEPSPAILLSTSATLPFFDAPRRSVGTMPGAGVHRRHDRKGARGRRPPDTLRPSRRESQCTLTSEAILALNLPAVLVGVLIGLLASSSYVLWWKLRYTAHVREDAIQRSLAVTSGKVHEQLIPYLPGFDYNPKDVRFLGSPVDLVVFDGLAEGEVRRIIFLEVKTGRATLTMRERSVRAVVQCRRVEWVDLRVHRPVTTGVA